MKSFRVSLILAVAAATALTVACSSAPAPAVDLSDSRRVLGRENNVRVDAQVNAEGSGNAAILYLVYQVENLREKPILLVANTHDASYDSATHTVTVIVGSEIPSSQVVLTRVNSGEKKSFTSAVVLRSPLRSGPARPRLVRVKVNYLDDTEPFEKNVKPDAPATLSVDNELFPLWLEHNESVVTNAVPLSVERSRGGPVADASRASFGTF